MAGVSGGLKNAAKTTAKTREQATKARLLTMFDLESVNVEEVICQASTQDLCLIKLAGARQRMFWQNDRVESQEQGVSVLVKIFRAAAASGIPILYFGELAFVIALVLLCIWFANREPESGFRVRESDLRKPSKGPGLSKKPSQDSLADAKLKAKPLELSGISLQGEPYEILGVRADATDAQIQKAYRELMKRYHPDIIGRPGSREWKDAQKIAEAINRAKSELLASRSKKSK